MEALLDRLAATRRTLVVGDVDGATRDRLRPFLAANNVALRVDESTAPGRCAVEAAGDRVAAGPLAPLVERAAGAGAGVDPSTPVPSPDPGPGPGPDPEADGRTAAPGGGRGADRDADPSFAWAGAGGSDGSTGAGASAAGADDGEPEAADDVVEAVVGTESAVRAASTAAMVRVSREVERHAWRARGGRLRAGFQRLSAVATDEETRRRYARLDGAGVDVAVYGVPDVGGSGADAHADGDAHGDGGGGGGEGPADDVAGPLGFPVVPDDAGALADYWFVLFDGGPDDRRATALVCRETDGGRFDGYWTRSPSLARECFALAAEAHPSLFPPPS